MAQVIHLKLAAPLPNDAKFVLVSRFPAGGFDIAIWTQNRRHTTIAHDVSITSLNVAIQRATAEADRDGIRFVYVQGGESA